MSMVPVSSLHSFSDHSRISDPSAPTFDSTLPPKDWLDPNPVPDASGNVAYQIAPQSWGKTTPDTLMMGANTARTLNLPGLRIYPPAPAPEPTGATFFGSTLTPDELSLQADAVALAEAWGLRAQSVVDGGVGVINYPADEPRRVWTILWVDPATKKLMPLCVAMKLAQQYANGVGAPGSWDTTGTKAPEPLWVPGEETASTPTLPFLPPPLKLPDGTTFVWSMFGVMAEVSAR